MAAPLTPGRSRTRSSMLATAAVLTLLSAYFCGDSGRFTTRRFSGLNPGGTCVSVEKLRSSRPAPTSSTRARPTSTTTRVARVFRCWTPPNPPLPSSLSEWRTFDRIACTAGTSPNTSPVRIDTPTANTATGHASPMFCARGSAAALAALRSDTPHKATSNPAAPLTHARTTLSIRSCRKIRPRPAPSAKRSAISLRRPTPRASSRLATFAQAISRTSTTAPRSIRSAGRTFCTSRSCTGVTSTRTSRFDSGSWASSWRAIASISSRASSSDTPRLTRAIGKIPGCQPRSSGSVAAQGPNGT